MIFYDMPLWRPPSEGSNLIIQATLGCSFNACTFCSMYTVKSFEIRPLNDIFHDIEEAAKDAPDARRIFLADGDALVTPSDDLVQILDKLAATFPQLQRVSSYATPINLNTKTLQELRVLKEKRLSLIYFGLESGSDRVLKYIHKGKAKTMETALAKADAANIKVSATLILGLGGEAFWREHILKTAELINAQPPRYVSTLQLGLDEAAQTTFIDAYAKSGEAFVWQDDGAILNELQLLLESLNPPRPIIFRSNHGSNCLPLAGTLPKDTPRLLNEIQQAKIGISPLRPKDLRSF